MNHLSTVSTLTALMVEKSWLETKDKWLSQYAAALAGHGPVDYAGLLGETKALLEFLLARIDHGPGASGLVQEGMDVDK